jgi:aspartate/methionine/tyrosine aminotransferase
VIVTSGCLEAIPFATCGNNPVIPWPLNANLFWHLPGSETLGLKVVEVTSCSINGIELDCLEKAIENYSIKACIVVPNFNNPLGSCMPDENKKKLVDIITKHNIH